MKKKLMLVMCVAAVAWSAWLGYPRQLPKDERQVTFSIVRYNQDGTLHSKYDHTRQAGYRRYQLGTNIQPRWFSTTFDVRAEDGRWVGRMKR